MKLIIDSNILLVFLSVFLFIAIVLNGFLLVEIFELRKQNSYLCNSVDILSNLENYNLELVREVRSFMVFDSNSGTEEKEQQNSVESVLYHS